MSDRGVLRYGSCVQSVGSWSLLRGLFCTGIRPVTGAFRVEAGVFRWVSGTVYGKCTGNVGDVTRTLSGAGVLFRGCVVLGQPAIEASTIIRGLNPAGFESESLTRYRNRYGGRLVRCSDPCSVSFQRFR